jgi:hypothetical protein
MVLERCCLHKVLDAIVGAGLFRHKTFQNRHHVWLKTLVNQDEDPPYGCQDLRKGVSIHSFGAARPALIESWIELFEILSRL